ncbi:MAG: holo-ACP synthase [Candidatus Latescibacteria bacterium]|nr:holo-ACP synthase [Candidatus Latescibacterota bacterium]
MIVGIGIDIVQISRLGDAVDRYGDRFLRRVFTDWERAYCEARIRTMERYAARFAAKEAAFKALGRGWDAAGGFTSVEVLSGEAGNPVLMFHGRAEELFDRLGATGAYLSLTHDAGVSAAVVVLER